MGPQVYMASTQSSAWIIEHSLLVPLSRHILTKDRADWCTEIPDIGCVCLPTEREILSGVLRNNCRVIYILFSLRD